MKTYQDLLAVGEEESRPPLNSIRQASCIGMRWTQMLTTDIEM